MASRQSSADEEEEVFEITDFTTVSDWEKFIAQISEAISDWQLTCIDSVRPLQKNELTRGTWEQLSKEIRFANAVFMLMLYRLKQENAEEVFLEESENVMEDELRMPLYMDDMMSGNNDFPPRAHCLARWYGFRSFLVLSLVSSGNQVGSGLTSESKCNLLLSSACIVLSDSACEVPIFIQIQQNWRKMFTGRCLGTGMQTEFEMVHLKKCPLQYQHLSGLLHAFKSKIGMTISPVQVSARFTYILSHWGKEGSWPKDGVNPDTAALTFDRFLFGSLDDPIGDLQLSAIWPSITEHLIIENDVHSDFEPSNAPVWTVRLHYADNPECLLSNYLSDLMKIRFCKDSVSDMISTTIKSTNSSQDLGQVFDKLTDSSHKMKQIVPLVPELTSGLSKIVTTPRSIWRNRIQTSVMAAVGPIKPEHLEVVMDFLFCEESDEEMNADANSYTNAAYVHETEHQLKSAPKNSVTYRLAQCVTVANFCHGGVQAVAQIWYEFVQEMRYRFENGLPITGLKTESPDLRCCLLHQKLQMLNCCINHKIQREKDQKNKLDNGEVIRVPEISSKSSYQEDDVSHGSAVREDADHSGMASPEVPLSVNSQTSDDALMSVDEGPLNSPSWHEGASSEDEFYECDDGEDVEEVSELPKKDGAHNSEIVIADVDSDDNINDEVSIVNTEVEAGSAESIGKEVSPERSSSARGRLQPFGIAKLLNKKDSLYIPVTQEPAPLTEDALEEQTKIFSSLGDSAEGAILRRKMQSASLLSDMESFKAANPGSVLADFVRWYSPRDYEEVQDSNGLTVGALSDRMKIPGNLWQTMWETAKPIPARRQKRLFDDTKEGEKVLHFMSSLQPRDVVLYLLPMCFHEAIITLRSKVDSSVPSVSKLCDQIFTQSCRLFQSNYIEKFSQMDDILQKVLFTETLVERTMSLKHKFSRVKDCESFVRRLVDHPEVVLEGGANGEVGKIIKEYFLKQEEASMQSQQEGTETSPRRNVLPPPSGREYILRNSAPRPSPQSRILPHRLYAVLMKNEFRLAGAFSSDTVFF